MKKCQLCDFDAVKGERYCKACKQAVLRKLKHDGYLQANQYGYSGQSRTSDMKENISDTKHGTGQG